MIGISAIFIHFLIESLLRYFRFLIIIKILQQTSWVGLLMKTNMSGLRISESYIVSAYLQVYWILPNVFHSGHMHCTTSYRIYNSPFPLSTLTFDTDSIERG